MNPNIRPERREYVPATKADLEQFRNHVDARFDECSERIKEESDNGRKGFRIHRELIDKNTDSIGRIDERLSDHSTRIQMAEQQIAFLVSSSQHQHVQSESTIGHLKTVSSITQSISDRFDEFAKNDRKGSMPTAGQAAKSPVVWTVGGLIALVQVIIGVAWYFATGDATLIKMGG